MAEPTPIFDLRRKQLLATPADVAVREVDEIGGRRSLYLRLAARGVVQVRPGIFRRRASSQSSGGTASEPLDVARSV